MAEPTREFERRAYAAAPPVFLVGLGAVLLLVLGILILFTTPPPLLTWGLALVGLTALVAGLAWGFLQEARTSRRPTSRPPRGP